MKLQPFQGQAALYLGKEAAKFRSAFRAFGFIVEPSERDNGNQLGYFGPIPTQAERTNVNELHAQLRAMWPAGQDVLAKSSCVTSVWR